MAKKKAMYGTWSSPLQPRHLGAAARFMDARWDTASGALVWLESRAGQSMLIARQLDDPYDDGPRELIEGTPIRGGLFYGGGEFTVQNGTVYFCGGDGRLYRKALSSGRPRPITPAIGGIASPAASPDGQWVVYVNSVDGIDSLMLVDSHGAQLPRKLLSDSDFLMQPTWSPDGTQIAVITYNQPNMGFDGTVLRLITIERSGDTLRAASVKTLTGDTHTAIFQPEFSPDGRWLAYVSDAAGWWQLYAYDLTTGEHRQLTTDHAEYAVPAWLQGLRTYGWTRDSRALIAIRNAETIYSLVQVTLATREITRLDTGDYTYFQQIDVSRTADRVSVLASASDVPERLLTFELAEVKPRIITRSSSELVSRSAFAKAEPITWTGHDGEAVHGLFMLPASERYMSEGLAPLIVYVHGGPTSQSRVTFFPDMQFYATRGYAVLQVNHRGSTGYGKAYKDMGQGNWGLYEVEDSATGAQMLAAQSLVDETKRVIYGSSSGGLAVLQSLVEKPGFYTAGVCRAGVANQFSLVGEGLDKFEARYSERILGTLPEHLALYKQRSPVFHAHRIQDPLILFHGTDDHVVPPQNSQQIAAVLAQRGVPHELYLYEGEGHSFRKPEHIKDFYEKILAFLERFVVYA